mgnify:FL=1
MLDPFIRNYLLEDPPEDHKLRRWNWRSLTLRCRLLEDRIPNEEFLKEDFLEDNDFEKSCMFKGWAESDYEELQLSLALLKKIELIDGPPTEADWQELEKWIEKLEERIESQG